MVDGINFDQSLLKGAIAKKSDRKKATDEQIQSAFTAAKADGQLNKQEIAKLKEMGLTDAQIKDLQGTTEGMQTLNDLAYSHLGTDFGVRTGENAANDTKIQKQAEVTEFVLADGVNTFEEVQARLDKFDGIADIDNDEFRAQIQNTFITENLGRKETKLQPDLATDPEAKPVDIRVKPEADDSGKITKIALYEGDKIDDTKAETEPSRVLTAEGKYFIEGEGDNVKYYSYNAEAGTLADVTTNVKTAKAQEAELAEYKDYIPQDNEEYNNMTHDQKIKFLQGEKQKATEAAELAPYAEFVPTDEAELEEYNKLDHAGKLAYLQGKQQAAQEEAEAQQVIADRKEAFANIKQNGITIDETGSTQRLTGKQQWNTSVVLSKEVNEEGYPSKISIALPGGYGSTGSDGVGQKRYHSLYYDAATNTYADKRGLRRFEVNIGEDGKITLKQLDAQAASAGVKKALDNDTRIVQQRTQQAALNEDKTKFKKDVTANDAKTLLNAMADRNKSWETYLQAGTENGYLTGALGMFEEMKDEKLITSYKDIQPAVTGLMSRIPAEVVKANPPEYQTLKAMVDEMEKTGKLPSKMRNFDLALINFAKTHLAGKVQGTNHANNSYLVGGGGKVKIQPDDPNSMWMSDAKFTIGGTNYYLYQEQTGVDRTVDFQDAVRLDGTNTKGHQALLSNDLTGNNRQGAIKANAQKFSESNFYFAAGGKEYKCVVEKGIVYVQSPNGKVKVPLEDVLNGRRPMPKDPAAS